MKTITSSSILCTLAIFYLWGCTPESNTGVSPISQATPLLLIQPTPQETQTTQSEMILAPTEITSPTIDVSQSNAAVNELLLTNNGCELPCFWGIIPGKTTWEEASFLKNLAVQYDLDLAEESQDYFDKTFYFPVLNRHNINMSLDVVVFKNTVLSLEAGDFEADNFELANFLIHNGQPDEIWVFTNSKGFGTDNHIGFLIFFYYHEKQMTVSYSGNGEIGEYWIVGCTTLSPHIKIWAWDDSLGFPESTLSNMDIIRTTWKSLDEATQGELDASKYYETFKEPQHEPCIKTPKSIWSEP